MLTNFLPVALSYPWWETMQSVCRELKVESPTRGHDQAGIQLKEPAAWLAALSFDNQPLNNLRTRAYGMEHVFASFLGSCSLDTTTELSARTRLAILRRNLIVLITGSMGAWYESIVTLGSLTASFETRAIITDVYHFFNANLFKEVFAGLTIVEHSDKTILISRHA